MPGVRYAPAAVESRWPARQPAIRRATHAPTSPPAVAPAAIETTSTATSPERWPQCDDATLPPEVAPTSVTQSDANALRTIAAVPSRPGMTPGVAPMAGAGRRDARRPFAIGGGSATPRLATRIRG